MLAVCGLGLGRYWLLLLPPSPHFPCLDRNFALGFSHDPSYGAFFQSSEERIPFAELEGRDPGQPLKPFEIAPWKMFSHPNPRVLDRILSLVPFM